jgi:hypothetical protein
MSTPEATNNPYGDPGYRWRRRFSLGLGALWVVLSLLEGAWLRAAAFAVMTITAYLVTQSQRFQRNYRRRWERGRARKAAKAGSASTRPTIYVVDRIDGPAAGARTWLLAGLIVTSVGGALLFVASFLPWFTISLASIGSSLSISANGWEGPRSAFSGGAAILGVAVAAAAMMVLLRSLSGEGWQLVVGGWIAAGFGAVALLLVMIKLAQVQPTFLERGPAFWVAGIGAVGVMIGGVLTGLFAARFVAATSVARSPLAPPPPG